MNRELSKRLAKLESNEQNATVKAISDLMDELSDIAAGGDGKRRSETSLEHLFEVEQ